jgi:transcriptional antiterminator RfaH
LNSATNENSQTKRLRESVEMVGAGLVDGRGAGARWYVVHTRPRMEAVAEANLAAQGFEAFLPAIFKTVRHARKFRTVRAAFFPRYLFVRLDLERQRWRSVAGTIGVAHFVMEGERPKPALGGIVEDLIAMTGSEGVIAFAAILETGDRVQILAGPFAGCLGELARLDDQNRVRVFLEVLGGKIPLDLAAGALARAA